ncbi:hypothetical protein CRENBAI_007280 [Crenichthys baileyi]|uniref:Uncharacterized protein n=1 Tax=Crenichthys baileyi TaxID=28760 RepID=A0AAV9QRU4_9TELE
MGAEVTGFSYPAGCYWENLCRWLPALRRLSVSQQWLLSSPASVSSSFPDSWIKNLLSLDSSLQLPSLDKIQAGSFLAPRSTGLKHKRTLFTFQCALVQVPPPSAPRHLLTHHGLSLTGLPENFLQASIDQLTLDTYLLSLLQSRAPSDLPVLVLSP